MKYIYNSQGILENSVYEGTEEEIKKQYGEGIYISVDYYGESAIVENNRVREKTRVEKIKDKEDELLEGEYIENGEIKYIEKPNNFYFWDLGKSIWVYDQELEKSFLEEEIGTLEGEISGLYDELDKAVARKLKMREKKLNEEIEKLNEKIENKYKRYNELEG